MPKPVLTTLAAVVAVALLAVLPPPAGATPPPAKAPAKEPAMWGKLSSEDGKRVFPLNKPVLIVGSAPTADVRIEDPTVAPQHARLTHKDGAVEIEDLGSKTGTLAAGTALKKGKPFRILQRMALTLGAVTLQFDFGERPALIPPSQKPTKGKGKSLDKPEGQRRAP